MANSINFSQINQRALTRLPHMIGEWAPDGKTIGGEYVATNPTRNDHHPGSFKINLRTGKWADFATGDRGGDVISLLAYLTGSTQINAAKQLQARMG